MPVYRPGERYPPRVPVYRLDDSIAFPDPREAEASGLLAVGGDLRPERLLLAYANGIFPWFDEPPILWFSPDPRAAIRPREIRVSRRLERTLRSGQFALSLDRDFSGVMRHCAEVPRPGQDGTWITADMRQAYGRLHELGFAHSCEAWLEERLVGGIYGVSLGTAFFAESMFFLERDASKVAWVTLVRQLADWGFALFDAQIENPHLARFGVTGWDRERYLEQLRVCLTFPTRRGRWRLGDPVDPEVDPAEESPGGAGKL